MSEDAATDYNALNRLIAAKLEDEDEFSELGMDAQLRGMAALKRATKAERLARVFTPRQAAMDRQLAAQERMAETRALGATANALIRQYSDLQGDEASLRRARMTGMTELLENAAADARLRMKNADDAEQARIDRQLNYYNYLQKYMSLAERLTAPDTGTRGKYVFDGLSNEEKILELTERANKLVSSVYNQQTVGSPKAKAHKVASDLTLADQQLFAKIVKKVHTDGRYKAGAIRGEDGEPMGHSVVTERLLEGINNATAVDSVGTRRSLDEAGVLTQIESDPEMDEGEKAAVRASLLALFQGKNAAGEDIFMDQMAGYRAIAREAGASEDEINHVLSFTSFLHSVNNGDDEAAMDYLDTYYDTAFDSKRAAQMDSNNMFQNMLLQQITSPRVSNSRALNASRKIITSSQEFQEGKEKHGFVTDDAYLKYLYNDMRKQDREAATHDRDLLKAYRRGATPDTIAVMQAMNTQRKEQGEKPLPARRFKGKRVSEAIADFKPKYDAAQEAERKRKEEEEKRKAAEAAENIDTQRTDATLPSGTPS